MKRPLARGVLALALVLCGAVAASRIEVDVSPEVVLPELHLYLSLQEATEPADVAQRWVVPLESALRAVGGVREVVGRVGSSSASLSARLAPGVDARAAAARLGSELHAIREALEGLGQLSVDVGARGRSDSAALLVLSGPGAGLAAEDVAERLRSISGVRDVAIYGAGAPSEVVVLHDGLDAVATLSAVRAGLVEAVTTRVLGGEAAGPARRAVITTGGGVDDLARVPIRLGRSVVPLSALADVARGVLPASTLFRADDAPAIALAVERHDDAALLRLDHELRLAAERETAAAHGAFTLVVETSEADALKAMLQGLLRGAIAAALAALLLGLLAAGWRGALVLVAGLATSLAAGANVLWLAGGHLDPVSLPALTAGIGLSCIPSAARLLGGLRASSVLVAGACLAAVPLAVELGAGRLSSLLAGPARLIALAAFSGLVATLLVPAVAAKRRGLPGERWLLLRALRDPVSVVLAAATAALVSFTLFGQNLDPRAGTAGSEPGVLVVSLSLPPGAALDEAEALALRLEDILTPDLGVLRQSLTITAEQVVGRIELGGRAREGRRLEETRLALVRAVSGLAASANVRAPGTGSTGSAVQFDAGWGTRPETDENCTRLRAVVRGSDARAVATLAERLSLRLAGAKLGHHRVDVRWGTPGIQVELVPRADTPSGRAQEVLRMVSERSRAPQGVAVPGRRQPIRLVAAELPEDRRDTPRLEALVGRPLGRGSEAVVPTSLFDVSRQSLPSALDREDGRFVLPVDVWFTSVGGHLREKSRLRAHQSLSTLTLPDGCSLELPELEGSRWTAHRLSLLGLALLLPGLLFVAGAVRLNSLWSAAACLVVVVLAAMAAAPVLGLARLALDEMTLLGLTTAASVAVALAVSAAAGLPDAGLCTRSVHRIARGLATPLACGTFIMLALLLGAAWGSDWTAQGWAGALGATALVGLVSAFGALIAVPAVISGARALRHSRSEAMRHLRRPPAWLDAHAVPTLAVRSVTKVYKGGQLALRDVSFEVAPSVVGLLGPNGAGKTTLLRILTGLLEPTRGQVLVQGVPVLPLNLLLHRARVGYLPQEFNAYPGFTAEEFLAHWSALMSSRSERERRAEIDQLLQQVGLAEHARRKVRDFSGGMRQRIGIARALLGAPPMLVVDEPTTGLDLEARGRLRETLLAVAASRIVILSTHLAGDIEATASRVLVLHGGRLRLDATPAELVARARGRAFETLVQDAELREFSRAYRLTARVRVLDGIRVRGVAREGMPLPGRSVEPTLEEAYLVEVDRAERG